MGIWVKTQDRHKLVYSDNFSIYEVVDRKTEREAETAYNQVMECAYNYGSTEKARQSATKQYREIMKGAKISYRVEFEDSKKQGTTLGEYDTMENAENALFVLESAIKQKEQICYMPDSK